ncbi:MAG TPA: PIN domain-containing protein [Thermoanaerobaculia bacterium]
MRVDRVYADTSVFGGYFDEEFSDRTRPFFARLLAGAVRLVVSELAVAELERAPAHVRALLEELPPALVDRIPFNEEARGLADLYLQEGVVRPKMKVDAQHIATATVHRVDVLVSWNFRDIVNLRKIHGINAVNLRLGYPMLEIRTPAEVIRYD